MGKVFTLEQIQQLNQLNWQGKSGDLFTSRGGFNCRHHWQPVKPEWLDDEDFSGLVTERGRFKGLVNEKELKKFDGFSNQVESIQTV